MIYSLPKKGVCKISSRKNNEDTPFILAEQWYYGDRKEKLAITKQVLLSLVLIFSKCVCQKAVPLKDTHLSKLLKIIFFNIKPQLSLIVKQVCVLFSVS